MIKYTKHKLIEVILKEIPVDSPYHQMTSDEIQSIWFVTKRGDGFQLTSAGDKAFQDAEIESYDRPIEWPMVPSSVLLLMPDISKKRVELSRKITCPYYLHEEKRVEEALGKMTEQYYHYVRLYDTDLTVWIDMHGGIQDYLKSVD